MADYWINLHAHTDESNAGGYFEIVTQYKDYVKYALDNHLPAVAVTNHGNVARWIKHKELADEVGLKYIHGIEAYTAMSLDDKSRYHTIIIAKNYDGVKEINQLSSNSFNRNDGHYYYKPRIMFDELAEAVDHGNLYVTTACMAGPLAQAYFNDDTEVRHQWINFAKKYPERVFLEIQPHDNREQAQYNDYLVKLAQQHNLKLIASNDVHALNQYHDKLRKIIKKGKGSQYDNEDEFELWLKDRSEMIRAFQKQGVVTTELVQKALDLTVEIAESVEPFEIDKSHKYPKLYDNPEAEFQKRIKQGIYDRGIDKLPADERKKYLERIQYEYSVYKHNGAIDYMLSHEDIMNAAKEHGAHFGPGRGSCFAADTKVMLSNYDYKKIKDVSVGDLVITSDGTAHRVLAVHHRSAKELYTIRAFGSSPITATGNHKFLVRDKDGSGNDAGIAWREVRGLTTADFLCIPKIKFGYNDIPIIDLVSFKRDAPHDTDNIWLESSANHIKTSVAKRFIDPSDPKTAWLLGCFIGNGWTTHANGKVYSMGICFNSDHEQKIARAENIIKDIFGVIPKKYIKKQGKKCVQLVINNQFVAEAFSRIFGERAGDKHIPDFFMTSANDEALKSLIRGLWDTDGTFDKNEPRWAYHSTNERLVHQISNIMKYFGYLGGINRYSDKRGWSPVYTISYTGGQLESMNSFFDVQYKLHGKRNHFTQDGDYFYVKVRSVAKTDENDTDVYDLTVENNHTYTANDVVVHNCTGSIIAYLCGQTEMDAVRLGLNFERFMSKERISLADIDVDLYSDNQQWTQQWMLTNDKWHAASILTANTYGLKAAIKAIADGLPRYAGKPQYIQSIRNEIGDNGVIPREVYDEHQELIDMAQSVVGVIDSFGRHAAGIVIDTNTIDDAMGTMTISGWDYPVTQITMKEIDHNNWVKYDVLGLDNVGLIEKTAELAGIPYPTPDSDFIDFEDKAVWESMRQNNIGVFQMEGDRAGKLLRDMLSPDTIKKIKSNEAGKNVKYMDLLSLVNAAQRPSGASYVDQVTHGEFKDNGHPALNEFLAPTLGNIVYQEQLIQFLVEFCGYTPGAADLVRRGVAKKSKVIMDNEVPKIKPAFIKTMVEKYGDSQEHAENIADSFIQVFMDAVNYGFSVNHSMAYSYIGYISTWLRYYYPLEWCTAAFEVWKGKQEKINRVSQFAKSMGIDVRPVRYGRSKGLYFMNKDENAIYEGTASIKSLNTEVGDYLYQLSDKDYTFFTDFLVDLYEKNKFVSKDETLTVSDLFHRYDLEEIKNIDLSSEKCKRFTAQKFDKKTTVNSRHVLNLIVLKYFKDFAKNRKLQEVFDYFKKTYKPQNKRWAGKYEKYMKVLEFEKSLKDQDLPLKEQLDGELKLLGRCQSTYPELPSSYAYVTQADVRSSRVKVRLYSPRSGKEVNVLLSKSAYFGGRLKEGSMIKLSGLRKTAKSILVDGHWRKSEIDFDYWITDYKVV